MWRINAGCSGLTGTICAYFALMGTASPVDRIMLAILSAHCLYGAFRFAMLKLPPK
jgi:hypothetical protein